MKIFQFSDLHLDEKFDIDEYKSMLEKMCEIIKANSICGETIYLLCCGDIVDKGNERVYAEKAEQVFDEMRRLLEPWKVEFIFVPGNHDLCTDTADKKRFGCIEKMFRSSIRGKNNVDEKTLNRFQNFITQYNTRIDVINNNVILYETPDIDFLLLNSVYHKDHTYGKFDLELLNRRISESRKPIVVVMHHTLMNRYEDDRSSITNGYDFLNQMETHNVIGVLHGHTHGYSNILIGNNCRVIGVGSLFKYFPNCNNQFNIINVGANRIDSVINYRYSADLDKFSKHELFNNPTKGHFEGTDIKSLYEQVKDAVRYYGGIYHLTLTLETDITKFNTDMESEFADEIEIAKDWLKELCPEDLYYNHGSYMKAENIKGINYVINELKTNSTSNRAVIPLIKLDTILGAQHSYLPGLTSVQFGFENDHKDVLICDMHLRSLEVNHFLRINLSEMYLMIKEICDEIRSVERINLNLYAFKAQAKEKFSCFRKAMIDRMTPGKISDIVYSGDCEKLYELLQKKFQMEETIVNTSGLEVLLDVLANKKERNEIFYDSLKTVIGGFEELRKAYDKSSNYENIRSLEEKVQKNQQKCLDCLNTAI